MEPMSGYRTWTRGIRQTRCSPRFAAICHGDAMPFSGNIRGWRTTSSRSSVRSGIVTHPKTKSDGHANEERAI